MTIRQLCFAAFCVATIIVHHQTAERVTELERKVDPLHYEIAKTPLWRVRPAVQSELRHVGVLLLDEQTATCQCVECKEKWTPELENGFFLRYYWHCPNKCNVKGGAQ